MFYNIRYKINNNHENNMNKNVLLMVCVMLFSTSTNAYTTLGVRSCGEWIKDRGSPSVMTAAQLNWLGGYLTGVSEFTRTDIINSVDKESLYLWVDNYCKAHPLEDTSSAAYNLTVELLQRANKNTGK